MGLFNRPKSVPAATDESGQPKDIFSHSQSYSAIVAEQDRRRKERAEKKIKKEGKRKSDEWDDESPRKRSSETPKKKTEDAPKRRRISGQDVGRLMKDIGLGDDVADEGEEEIVMENSPRKENVNGRIVRSSSRTLGEAGSPVEVVDVGESSDDEVRENTSRSQKQTTQRNLVEDEDDESDPELAALARQARQRRLQKTQSATPDIANNSPAPRSGDAASPHTGPQSPPFPDPAVQVLVISRIEGAKPLMVYRKLSQNLKEIRLAYCKRQNFPEDFTEQVFLVHRMRRVYDVTTCRSLGLETDTEGNITMKGAEGKEGVDQVALEAVTDDIFQKMLAEKEKEDVKRRNQWDPVAEAAAAEAEEAAAEAAAGDFLKIVLKAKGKPDFNLEVRPSTQFARVIKACRKKLHVADGATVTLDFDGDALDPEAQIDSTEISDMDVVDVHIS